MKHYTRFSARASLIAAGRYMHQQDLWQPVVTHVQIPQKVRNYQPLDKLKMEFVNILAGGQGGVEVNTRVRPDEALQRAFDLPGCAEQSVVSTTVNACTAATVGEMRQAQQAIYRRQSRSYRHNYDQQVQVLDADVTGLLAGQQAEGATKGYYPGTKNRRGRQVGRVLATRYDEIVVDRLYPGTRQLESSLQELIQAAEEAMALTPAQRARTVVRVDGGGGRDADLNWLLERDYLVLAKVKNWKRAYKLAASVTTWYPDPKTRDREWGWVEAPYAYSRPTRQLAVRVRTNKGTWHYWVVVWNVPTPVLSELGRQPVRQQATPDQEAAAALAAYDLRGGGVETANKGSKLGLGLNKRNKKPFAAQEMLVVLAQLAYNVVTWTRMVLAPLTPALQGWGPLRIVRDVFQIPGRVRLDTQGHILQIILQQTHPHAVAVQKALAPYLARDGTSLILRKI